MSESSSPWICAQADFLRVKHVETTAQPSHASVSLPASHHSHKLHGSQSASGDDYKQTKQINSGNITGIKIKGTIQAQVAPISHF